MLKKIILYVSLVALGSYMALKVFEFKYDRIDLLGTLGTKYYKIKQSQDQMIVTDFFRLRTPNSWWHLDSGVGVEGHPYGSFFTPQGSISYEYGDFAPLYLENDSLNQYQVQRHQIDRFDVFVARNQNGEVGITIPAQHEMRYHLTFDFGLAVAENLDLLLAGIKDLEFKTFNSPQNKNPQTH